MLVGSTRNVFFYTGTYNGTRITVGASGMGCPSIGIYSYELYNEYDVECIIRIGTAGSYHAHIGLYELINVDVACSESTYAKVAFDYPEDCIPHQGNAYDIINATATKMQQNLRKGHIHSSDVFYRKVPGMPAIVTKYDCMAVEMEAFSLVSNAKALGKTAATLPPLSEVIPTHEEITADAR